MHAKELLLKNAETTHLAMSAISLLTSLAEDEAVQIAVRKEMEDRGAVFEDEDEHSIVMNLIGMSILHTLAYGTKLVAAFGELSLEPEEQIFVTDLSESLDSMRGVAVIIKDDEEDYLDTDCIVLLNLCDPVCSMFRTLDLLIDKMNHTELEITED